MPRLTFPLLALASPPTPEKLSLPPIAYLPATPTTHAEFLVLAREEQGETLPRPVQPAAPSTTPPEHAAASPSPRPRSTCCCRLDISQAFKVEKEAFCSIMALPTPGPIFNENLQINGGKRADGLRTKGLKPSENPGKQGRRALGNLSNITRHNDVKDTSTLKEKSQQKPRSNVTNTIKGNGLKDKSILKEKSTQKQRSEERILKEKPAQKQRSEALKNPLKILTDEEINMCHEWAKDGVEGFHSTQNDSQKLDKDLLDKRVKKKVASVNSALRGWSSTVFDSIMFPATEVAEFFDEPSVLELEPEILPDISWRLPSSADGKEDHLTDDELDLYPSLEENNPVMFQLRDEPAIPQLGVY